MRRLLVTVLLLLISAFSAQAQAQPGSPPLLDHLSASSAGAGLVSISGSGGAVYAGAYVAVRNLYTGATAYTHAGTTGSFSVTIAGSVSSPYWVSPADALPGVPGAALPGGPGVILYDPLATAPADTPPVTPIAIDGDISDWKAFPDALRFSSETQAIDALRNAASLYVAVSNVPGDYAQVEFHLTIDTASYTLTLDPRREEAAALARTNPAARPLDPLIVAARQAITALEVRIPLSFVPRANRVSLDSVRWLDASGAEIAAAAVNAEIPPRDEADGVARPLDAGDAFSLAGTTASGLWSADGQISALALQPGAPVTLQMNLDYHAGGLPADARMIGIIALQPVARRESGDMRAVSGVGTNNGWSSVLTIGGLPIDNLPSSIPLGEARALPYMLVRGTDDTQFPLDFALTLPDDLAPGLYVPTFMGVVEAADGTRTRWTADGAHLPLVLNVGGVTSVRLPWTLLADDPSDGSRGILPLEDRNKAALSNRVRFNSPTYVLPPFKPGTRDPILYPLAPYLLNELTNQYSASGAPLIPFKFPGQISARVTRPDGTVDDLGSLSITQNQLSTGAADERDLFGAQSPVDEYRLATQNAKLSAYAFKQYGEYTIHLTGGLSDVWGNRYDGGGTYKLLVAEPLDLTPGAMLGTPFEMGDAFNPGLHLSPGLPADVTVTITVYPLDGSAPITRTFAGTATARGYFQPNDAPFVFDTPGEYIVNYEARYRDSDRRLWAASSRGAGVIASEDSALVARGTRGVPNAPGDLRPAWFNAAQYAQAAGVAGEITSLAFPYFSGDIAWVNDGRASLIQPIIQVANAPAYAHWLADALPHDGVPQLADRGELPVIRQGASDSYTYVSAVRPNVSVRQFVAGSDAGGLTLGWDEDDVLNRQIGAGSGGSAPGDPIFLFGGAVIRAGDQRETAIYGALAMVTDGETPRLYPPDRGAAGGADGGALLTINGQAVDTFINPTGVQPGEVLTVGDTVTLAGQVAPLLAATVTTTFTSPSGNLREFTGRANAIGYYYDAAAQFAVDEPGVWTVEVTVTQDGVSSSGQTEPPYPQGSILGAAGGHFSIYVLPPDAEPLPWNTLITDTLIPILSPYNFSFTLPSGWTNPQVFYTLSTPGLIIEQGELHVSGRSFTYPYSEAAQHKAFANLETDGSSGAWRSDVRTLTFVATGTDANGAPQIRSRTFALMHDRLITTE